MAINKHGLYGVVLNTGADVFIGGITALTISTGSEISSDPVSDNVYAQFQGLIRQRPTVLFSTLALVTALDNIGVNGLDVSGLATGVDYYAQKHADGGTRTAGANHIKYATTDGIIIPQTLTASGQGDAILTYQHIVIYDGSTGPVVDPIVKTSSVALPADTASSHLERFALGPITIESYVLTGVRSMTIDFGIQVEVEHEGSNIWPTFKGITAIQPVITFTGIDPAWLDNNATSTAAPELEGGAVTNGNTTIYLRKRKQTGFEADDQTVHIKMSCAGTFIIDTPMDATTNSASELTGRVICKYDGTNAPIKIDDTTSAIT